MSALPKVESEAEVREILSDYDESQITLYKVNALTAWNSKDKPVFGGWLVLKETEQGGEKELRQFENSGRDDGESAKEKAKEYARRKARENRPSLVKIETRDFETQQIEVAE